MTSAGRSRTYERIKADLVAEAQAVGVHTKGAPLDPVLELLINGFARELESVYDRVDFALEHNRRTLLRNYFDEPFLDSPAQTVVNLEMKQRGTIGPSMRMCWQRPHNGITPEYTVLSDREMMPLELGAVFYACGNAIYHLSWDEDLRLSSERFELEQSVVRPTLFLGLRSLEGEIDSSHLSFLIQPNETGIPGLFPGSDPYRSFCDYLDAGLWQVGNSEGGFGTSPALNPLIRSTLDQSLGQVGRFPTEQSLFGRMSEEHLYARSIRRFEPGSMLRPVPLPTQIKDLVNRSDSLKKVSELESGAVWLSLQLPYVVSDDPRPLLSTLAVNARLAIGYRHDPRDRFNFRQDDFNVRTELFEFGLADRPGRYCSSFGQWVVSQIDDNEGNRYPYVYESVGSNADRWFTLEAGADDITLILRLPRRKLPKTGHFDLYTGHLLGRAANTSDLSVLAKAPANALDVPEVAQMRLLVPAHGGGDGYAYDADAPDSFDAGGASILDRQYAKAAVWLRTKDRLITMPDMRSYLTAMDGRIAEIRSKQVSLMRDGQLVPGIRFNVSFDPDARLSPEEQDSICRVATKQMEQRTPVGSWVEVHPLAEPGA